MVYKYIISIYNVHGTRYKWYIDTSRMEYTGKEVIYLLCCYGFTRAVCQDVLHDILPSLFSSFLDEPLHSETLDVDVGHGSVTRRSAGLSKHSSRLPSVLVTHNLH